MPPSRRTTPATATATATATTVPTATYPSEIDPKGIKVVRLCPTMRIGNAPLLPQLPARLEDFDVIPLHQSFIFRSEIVAATAKFRNSARLCR
jgi:hypothetical protein